MLLLEKNKYLCNMNLLHIGLSILIGVASNWIYDLIKSKRNVQSNHGHIQIIEVEASHFVEIHVLEW